MTTLDRHVVAVARFVAAVEAYRGATPTRLSKSPHRPSSRRTHKASSAESIVRHVARGLGLWKGWRDGDLTDDQRLELLGGVRDYCRGWLHHEAMQLVREWGKASDGRRDAATSTAGAGPGIPRSLSAAARHRVGRFFDRARVFVREAILAGALALAGPAGLDADDLREADLQAAVQRGFLDRFERDVELRGPAELSEPSGAAPANPMTAAEFAARAEMYGGAAHTAAQATNRAAILRHVQRFGRAVSERRLHQKPDPAAHACRVCLDQSNRGWSPIGSLLLPGEGCPCKSNCDCYLIFRLDNGAVFSTLDGLRRATA